MLSFTGLMAFIPTKDAKKARPFYEGVLGLRFVSEDQFALVLEAPWDYGACSGSGGIQAATIHSSGLASFRPSERGRGPSGARGPF